MLFMFREIVFIVKLAYLLVAIGGVFYLGYQYGHWVGKWELYRTTRDVIFKSVGSMLVSYFTGGSVPIGTASMAAVTYSDSWFTKWEDGGIGGSFLRAIGGGQ